jgi:uncharacterized membrane-anchored protein YhcB (DUF1043 family)
MIGQVLMELEQRTSADGAATVLKVVFGLGLTALLVVVFVKYLSRSNKERQELQSHLDKLTDELERARKQAGQGKKGKSPPRPR